MRADSPGFSKPRFPKKVLCLIKSHESHRMDHVSRCDGFRILFSEEEPVMQRIHSLHDFHLDPCPAGERSMPKLNIPPPLLKNRLPMSNKPSPISPWLNLFRNDGSGISNYHTLVEPQLRQQKFNAQQQRVNQAQRAASINQQRQLQNISLQLRSRSQPQLGPTGTFQNVPANARFMNFSHFFGGR